eukprot:5221110-Prymnesium_polylepis.1
MKPPDRLVTTGDGSCAVLLMHGMPAYDITIFPLCCRSPIDLPSISGWPPICVERGPPTRRSARARFGLDVTRCKRE